MRNSIVRMIGSNRHSRELAVCRTAISGSASANEVGARPIKHRRRLPALISQPIPRKHRTGKKDGVWGSRSNAPFCINASLDKWAVATTPAHSFRRSERQPFICPRCGQRKKLQMTLILAHMQEKKEYD